jgi:hypothetical protein
MYIHPYDGFAHLTVFLITTHRQGGYMIDTFGNGITDPRKCGLFWRSIACGSKSRGADEVSEGGRSLGFKPCDDGCTSNFK